jgi:hypothetical protein
MTIKYYIRLERETIQISKQFAEELFARLDISSYETDTAPDGSYVIITFV